MTIYYVDSNASGANNGTNWTNAYADLETAYAGSVGTSDTVHCAHNHVKNYGATKSLTSPNLITVISVNSSTDEYQRGAIEGNSSGNYRTTVEPPNNGMASHIGMIYQATDRLIIDNNYAYTAFFDCSLQILSGSGGLYSENSYHKVYLKDCELYFTASNQSIVTKWGVLNIDGMTAHTSHVKTNNLIAFLNSGLVMSLKNTDLDSLIAATRDVFSSFASNSGFTDINIAQCKAASTLNLYPSSISTYSHKIDISVVDDGAGYAYFYQLNEAGSAEQDVTTYLNSTYDGTNGFSVLMASSSEASSINPLRYKGVTFSAQDLTSAKTVTVLCTSDAGLTDNDIWIEIEHNNSSNESLFDVITTQPADILAGTVITAGNTDPGWTSPDAQTYELSKDIGATANVDNGTVTVFLCVGKPSIDVNFDMPTIAAT
jgi:hypothetical protein